MTTLASVLAVLLGAPVIAAQVVPLASAAETQIRVTLEPEDRPKFKRVYRATVGDGFRVEVAMRTMFSDKQRWAAGELTQKNGRWILFDPRAVADKIIDRDLYPLVQAFVDRVMVMDAAFMRTNPSEFVDETGKTWRAK